MAWSNSGHLSYADDEGKGEITFTIVGDSPNNASLGAYLSTVSSSDPRLLINIVCGGRGALNPPNNTKGHQSGKYVTNSGREYPVNGDFAITSIRYETYVLSGIPVFNTYDDLKEYFLTGDTSKSLVGMTTHWTLYIDGSMNPLYKLTWHSADLESRPLNYAYVNIWIGKYYQPSSSIVELTKFKQIPYTDGFFKFSFSDISKLVEQPIVGHTNVCVIMQVSYSATPVVIPEHVSTKIACDLLYSSPLYHKLGYVDSKWALTTEGDGSELVIKDGQEGSDGYTNDDDKGYDDGKDDDDTDGDTTDISAGIGVLTTTFKMTKERLQQLGQFLWGSSIFDKFSLVNNNPIENIVSCKAIPLEQSGATQQIVLGNVETGVNGEKISNNFGKTTIGSVTISEYYKNFLDYSPYTNVIIYLPYIGFRELDTSMIMGKTLKVEYTTDCITGGCLAQISVGGVRLYEFTGNMGIDIPITASNRAQVEAGYIQAGVGAAMSLAGGNIAGATTALINSATAQYHYSSTGNPSPMCVASTNRTCYVVIDRPQYQKLNAFNHTRGQKCNLSKTIGSLKGFTICDSHIDLSGISATETEKEEIVNILSTGFFA